ncbi:Hypothetical predicted protein [Paramuricea clavata]|uniref:Uncharacterized protein n=1 Tax=Paramuricea clavata TaxID=317549 RepID=A0A6S7GW35_PARCT|nr:Hypothetical predicted protein [Paramuricea clavata]
MLEVIADLVRGEVCKTLHNSLCYSVQIDGSMDRQQQDSKFVTARHVQENEVSVETVFVGIVSSDKSGAEGLLDALCTSIASLESKQSDVAEETCELSVAIMTKMVGISTDGESANTGRKAGLWQLLKDKLKRNLITTWHLNSSVPELKYWMADVTAVSTFFRVSARRTKELHKIDNKCLVYPRHFEVRFAERTCTLLKAILHNLNASRKLWSNISDKILPSDSNVEIQQATGFCNKWHKGSRQVWLTALMYDVCQVFKELQQNFQRPRLILLEMITARETALRKLNLMKQGPIAGGMEEKYSINEIDDNESRGRRSPHYSAIRSEVIMSAVNFLGDRLQMEEDGTIANITRILKASSPKEIIDASR